MNSYYSRLESLRARLIAAGYKRWATELLVAETSATTSGEALSNTATVLKRLLVSSQFDVMGLRQDVELTYTEGDQMWNRGPK